MRCLIGLGQQRPGGSNDCSPGARGCFRMSNRPPDFFILGAPKSGTTALAETLDSHPSLTMSKPKEPHFFDAYYQDDLHDYLSRIFPSDDTGKLRGEATPSYLMVPWVAARIAKHAPQAKLIVCLRNPVDRAFSSWWMQFSRRLETLHFKDAIAADLAQPDLFKKENAKAMWASQIDAIAKGEELPIRTYVEAGLYHKHLTRFLEHFPRESIQVIFSGDLRSNRAKVLADIWTFLSVEPHNTSDAKNDVVNAAFGRRAMLLLRTAQKLGLMRVRDYIPASMREPIKAHLSRMGTAPQIDDEMRASLTAHFAESNVALEKLLAVDLSHWR